MAFRIQCLFFNSILSLHKTGIFLNLKLKKKVYYNSYRANTRKFLLILDLTKSFQTCLRIFRIRIDILHGNKFERFWKGGRSAFLHAIRNEFSVCVQLRQKKSFIVDYTYRILFLIIFSYLSLKKKRKVALDNFEKVVKKRLEP